MKQRIFYIFALLLTTATLAAQTPPDTLDPRYVIDGWRFLANSDPREQDQAELESLILDRDVELVLDCCDEVNNVE